MPLHVLLVTVNALAHPPEQQNEVLDEYNFLKIQFLPPNITPLLQSMDQQVISSLMRLYTKALFERCFEVTEGTNFTHMEFWRNHFHIVACLNLIEKA